MALHNTFEINKYLSNYEINFFLKIISFFSLFQHFFGKFSIICLVLTSGFSLACFMIFRHMRSMVW